MINIEKIKSKKTIKELLEFGIINIDKPSGPTSFQVSDFVRKSFEAMNVKKTSHFGTLDPKVTGVLPIALGRACKLTEFFIGKDKEYIGIMRVHKKIEAEKIKIAIYKNFVGKIKQLPPVRSRVKRREREREIKKFEILEERGLDFLFLVECQAGTYIRKLIHNIGEELGIGAHMLELRRIRAGIFSEENSHTLYEFEEAIREHKDRNENTLRKMIIPAEIISEIYPVLEIKEEFIKKILHGSPIFYKYLKQKKDLDGIGIFCVFHKDKFIGIYEVVKQEEIFAKPKFVFQDV